MASPALTFTLAYVVFAVCFVFTPDEMRSAGLTVQSLLAAWLGSEDVAFVQYHLRRSTGTLLVHSLLPLGEPRPAAGAPRGGWDPMTALGLGVNLRSGTGRAGARGFLACVPVVGG